MLDILKSRDAFSSNILQLFENIVPLTITTIELDRLTAVLKENDAKEILESMNRDQLDYFWEFIERLCRHLLGQIVRSTNTNVIQFLGTVIRWTRCGVSFNVLTNSLLTNITTLSQILLMCHCTELKSLVTAVSLLCEQLWLKNESGAESIVSQLFPHVLTVCTSSNVREADLKRLWNIRGASLLLDVHELQELIVRFAICKEVLKSAVGIKLVVYFTNLDKGIYCTVIQLF